MDELQWEHRLSVVEDRSKSNRYRLDELEKRQENLTELVKSVATIAQKQTDMDDDLQEIKQDVKGILAVPQKRWDTLLAAVITAIVTAVLTALLAA